MGVEFGEQFPQRQRNPATPARHRVYRPASTDGLIATGVNIDRAGPRIDEPHQPCAGPEIIVELAFHFKRGVARAEDLHGEIGDEIGNRIGSGFVGSGSGPTP